MRQILFSNKHLISFGIMAAQSVDITLAGCEYASLKFQAIVSARLSLVSAFVSCIKD